jgi:hypothetical protein
MELKNIFKMEMLKNWNNRPYLIVIAILAIMAATATFLGIAMIEGVVNSTGGLLFLLIPLIIFFALGFAVFFLLYPFNLLNVDYRNRVMSLIFASGVSREKYYFVKISATILTCLVAFFVILVIPVVAFLVVYPEEFVIPFQFIVEGFGTKNILPFALSQFFGMLAGIVILTTSVIITKGKVAGIFLYFGFSFAISILISMIQFPILFANMHATVFDIDSYMSMLYWGIVFSIVQIVGFVLLGLYVLRKQDL